MPPESESEMEASPNLLYAVEAPRMANFVYDLTRDGKPGALAKWKRFVLDPQYSTVMAPSLRFLRFPRAALQIGQRFERGGRARNFPSGIGSGN